MSEAAALPRIARYAERYTESYDYESRLVAARRAVTLGAIAALRPARVVEVGCGVDPLRAHARAAGCEARWVTVEPAEAFARAAEAPGDDRAVVVRGFFEAHAPAVRDALGGGADLVVIDSLLHEIPDEVSLLRCAREALAPGGVVHASVPNAYSLHRRLARAMGIIRDEHEASARNARLEQARVYDLATLTAAFGRAGLAVTAHGGHTLKPFTHAQMEAITAALGEAVFAGLEALGTELPELAAELWVHARRAP